MPAAHGPFRPPAHPAPRDLPRIANVPAWGYGPWCYLVVAQPPAGAGRRDGGGLPHFAASIMPRLYRDAGALASSRPCPHAGELNAYRLSTELPGRLYGGVFGNSRATVLHDVF